MNAENYREAHLIKYAKKYYEDGEKIFNVPLIEDALLDGYFNLVKYLLENNQKVDIHFVKEALKKGYFDIVEYLIKHDGVLRMDEKILEQINQNKLLKFLSKQNLPNEINKEIFSFLLFGSRRKSKRRSRKSNSIEAYFSKINTKFVNQYPKTRNRKECLPDSSYRHLNDLTTAEKTLVKNSQFLWCKGSIGKNYIDDMLVADKYIITAKYHPENKSMCGFIIFSILEDAIYIDLLCSISSDNFRGVSTSLMNKIKEIAIELGLKKIILSSVFGARGFYEKLGYVYTHDPCDVPLKESRKPVKKLYNMGICLE